jgi:hypothetical protein
VKKNYWIGVRNNSGEYMNDVLKIMIFVILLLGMVIIGSIISVRLFAPKVDEIKKPSSYCN